MSIIGVTEIRLNNGVDIYKTFDSKSELKEKFLLGNLFEVELVQGEILILNPTRIDEIVIKDSTIKL